MNAAAAAPARPERVLSAVHGLKTLKTLKNVSVVIVTQVTHSSHSFNTIRSFVKFRSEAFSRLMFSILLPSALVTETVLKVGIKVWSRLSLSDNGFLSSTERSLLKSFLW
ncbi:uncharacterized protein V6R79_007989 [Siganus canaliculatus]